MARPSVDRSRSVGGVCHEQEGERVMSVAPIGIDLGKNSCSLAGLDDAGAVVLRPRLTRERLVAFLAG